MNNVEIVPAKPAEKLRFDTDIAKFTPRQMQAVQALDSGKVKFLLYGGALGGGKSRFLRWFGIRYLMKLFAKKGLRQIQAMIACEDYPSLKDRQISKISREFPAWLGKSHSDHKDYGRCFILAEEYGSGVLCFRNLDDAAKYACYSEDTEILIKDKGFIPVAECKVGDFCFSLDPITKEMSWQKVTKMHEYQHDGVMYSYFSRYGPSYCVTPNHKMLYRSERKPEYRFVEAKDLIANYFIPRIGIWSKIQRDVPEVIEFESDGNNGKKISFQLKPFLRFLGLYLAEGSTDICRWSVKVSQHNGKNCREISDLLDSLKVNWHYSSSSYSFNNKAFVKYLKQFGKSTEKYIPQWIKDLPQEYLEEIWHGLMMGDGTKHHSDKFTYVTNSKRLRDDISEIGMKLGFVPTVYTYPAKSKVYPNGKTYTMKEYYHISLTKRVKETRCSRPQQIEYHGKVYCPTVPPYHTVCIRHRGRTMFCGQSAEFALILVDELTKNTYDTFTHLRTRLRWPGLEDIECLFVAGTNPGSIGHSYCKQLWLDKAFPDEFIHPIDYRSQFTYVPSKATDNPHLDKAYWSMLNTLPLSLRKAFRDGDWNVFVGQAFQEWTPSVHVIKPLMIPRGAPIYMTFDWGFGAPFSVGWWWVDADGRVYRFNEWYGWNGTANQGLRLPDTDVVDGIIKRESKMGDLDLGRIVRIAGPDCFQKRPDYRGGGQGPSTFEVFAQKGIYLQCGDPNRELKLRQFRERLRIPRDERGEIVELPKMLIYENCEHFIRTIPTLTQDKNNLEDIDQQGEDHVFDESSHICMARPVSQRISDTRPLTMAEKDWKVILGEESMSIHEQPGEGFEYVDENDIFG